MEAREITNKLLELADEGLISYRDLAVMALKWMSENSVWAMCQANEIFLRRMKMRMLLSSSWSPGSLLTHTASAPAIFTLNRWKNTTVCVIALTVCCVKLMRLRSFCRPI